jgi:hypothetical protein
MGSSRLMHAVITKDNDLEIGAEDAFLFAVGDMT